MNTYIVIPDAYDGGADWEMIVRAPTAQRACELVRDYLESERVGFTRAVNSKDDAKIGEDVWTVRKLPPLPASAGVIHWADCACTFWLAV